MTTTTTIPDMVPDVQLHNGHPTTVPDGTWYAIAEWSTVARDYIEVPALGVYSRHTQDFRDAAAPMGRRVIRYTVHQGYVTTRRGMGSH